MGNDKKTHIFFFFLMAHITVHCVLFMAESINISNPQGLVCRQKRISGNIRLLTLLTGLIANKKIPSAFDCAFYL